MKVADLGVTLGAGGLLWREVEAQRKIALVYRKRYDDWSLPKGKLDPETDDSWIDAAVREVREETGCSFSVGKFAGCVSYLDRGDPKVVLFWNMTYLEHLTGQPEIDADDLRWLSVPVALELLDYPEQRALIARTTGRCPFVTAKNEFTRVPWRGKLRSLGVLPRSAGHERLSNELATYEIELHALIGRIEQTRGSRELEQPVWADAARSLVNDTRLALHQDRLDLGWRCLHAAQRLELFGLNELNGDALKTRAQTVAREADVKLDGWRHLAVEDRLGKDGGLKEDMTVEDVYEASTILHDHFNNQYYKIGLLKRQSARLAVLALFTTIAVIGLHGTVGPIFGPDVDLVSGVFVLSVALFGVLGASVSGFLSLTKAGTSGKIPDQLISAWVTFARPMIGAAASLVLFGFLHAGLLQLGDPNAGLILVVAFAAGSSERFLDRAVRAVERAS